MKAALEGAKDEALALAAAGFGGFGEAARVRERQLAGYWIESDDPLARQALSAIKRIRDAVAPLGLGRSEEDLRVADYAVVRQTGYPAYLGGPFAFRSSKWA